MAVVVIKITIKTILSDEDIKKIDFEHYKKNFEEFIKSETDDNAKVIVSVEVVDNP